MAFVVDNQTGKTKSQQDKQQQPNPTGEAQLATTVASAGALTSRRLRLHTPSKLPATDPSQKQSCYLASESRRVHGLEQPVFALSIQDAAFTFPATHLRLKTGHETLHIPCQLTLTASLSFTASWRDQPFEFIEIGII